MQTTSAHRPMATGMSMGRQPAAIHFVHQPNSLTIPGPCHPATWHGRRQPCRTRPRAEHAEGDAVSYLVPDMAQVDVKSNAGISSGHKLEYGSLADSSSTSAAGLLVEEIRALPANQVADTLWGYVLTRGHDAGVFAAVATVVCQDMERYDVASLTAILSAAAQAGYRDRPFVLAAAEKLAAPYALAEVSEPSVLPQAVWALAMLDSQGVAVYAAEEAVQEAVAAIARHAARKVSDFSGDDLARLLAGLAQLSAPAGAPLLEGASARLQSTLIPMAQLSPHSLAQVVWAYARLGVYERGLFDTVQAEVMRVAAELGMEQLANVTWAYASIRDKDARHRAAYDANMLSVLAARCVELLEASLMQGSSNTSTSSNNTNSSPSGSTDSRATTAAATSPQNGRGSSKDAGQAGSSFTGGQTAQGEVEGQDKAGSVQQQTVGEAGLGDEGAGTTKQLLAVLLAYANLSHHDKPLFQWGAKYLAARMHTCSAQDMVVCAFVYQRVKHSAPALVHALAAAVPQVVSELDGEDLVYLATLGPATGVHNGQLMRAVLDQALALTEQDATAVDAASLLDLARCVAAVAHHEPEYYEGVQRSLLRAVNAAQLAADLEDMSTHCGATSPSGLQK